LFVECFLHIGHSPFCQYALYSMFPAGLIGGLASYFLIPWGMVQQGSTVWQVLEIVLVPLPFLLACVQYYLIGLIIDKLLRRRRSKREVADV
jgi:phage shock protein PspC (stress-responsive transcriptional regulator)